VSGRPSPAIIADGVAVALAVGVLAAAAGVLEACRPNAPLFDHAVLLADMLHAPPHLFRGHNEHMPVVPRLVFWLEAVVTDGAPLLPVAVGVGALAVGAGVVCQAWKTRARAVLAVVFLAAVLRPSLAWSVSWPTNIQYPLAFLGAAIAFSWPGRAVAVVVGGTLAALSSAEGLLVLPLAAVLQEGERARLRGLSYLALGVGLGAWTSMGGSSGLVLPDGTDDWARLVAFAGRLVAYPWSLRLWLGLVGPVLVGVAWLARRSGVDRGLLAMAVYGAAFAGLVVVGRWWLPSVHHRYALGATVAVVALVGAVLVASTDRSEGLGARGATVALAAVLALEAMGLGAPIAADCRATEPPGEAFWRGETDDGADAHPGFPAAIAVELRSHLWRAGLYRPSAARPDSPEPP